MDINYTVNKGKVFSKKGIPLLPRWFTDDLVAIQIDEYGIKEMQYFNPKTKGTPRTFVADMWGGLKFLLDDNGNKYMLDFFDVTLMPYGFLAKFRYEDTEFIFEERIINNSVYISVKSNSKIEKILKLSVEFYDAFSLQTHENGDYRYKSTYKREWDSWTMENDILYISFCEGGGYTYTAIGANKKCEYIKRKKGYVKNILNYNISEEITTIVIAFDYDKSRVFNKCKKTIDECSEFICEQNKRYDNVIKKAPVLKSKYEDLNNFVALAPLYMESLKVPTYEGAVKAKTEYYWVWGWDSMSSPFAYNYWGDTEFVGKILKLYQETADAEKSFAHLFNRDMTHKLTSVVSAQGFYISLLYSYFINGGDISPYYNFAKKIFSYFQKNEVKNLGLCENESLIPDFLEMVLETGNDISCFNNSTLYCAVRALEKMAKAKNDDETFKITHDFAKRTRENFDKILYDEESGFYFSSADSITLKARNVHNATSIKWDNRFCEELAGQHFKEALDYFENKFICRAGIRTFSTDDIAYDADANQGHCWWPAHSEFYTRMINRANRTDLIEQFIGWISNWTKMLMCPEGISCYINSEKPFLDYWTSNPGTWQGYSIRAWYEAVIHSIVGVDFDMNGLKFYPYSGEEMSILGLYYNNKILDIHMKGSGRNIEYIEVNGERYYGNITEQNEKKLKCKNEIIVMRTN